MFLQAMLKRRAECRVVDRVGFTSFHPEWVPFCLVSFVVFVLRCFVLVYLKGTWFFCELKCHHTRQSYKQSKISDNKVNVCREHDIRDEDRCQAVLDPSENDGM